MNSSNIIVKKEWEYIDLGQDKVKALLSACPKCFNSCYIRGSFQVQATQYVGAVYFDDDTVLEVLPKTESSDAEAKKLLETMIRTVYLKPQYYEKSFLGTVNDSILEYYVRMFCWEAEEVFRKGVSYGYSRKEENLSCVKGKILFNKDIRNNNTDRSKIFVSHEIYSDDRPENRIILKTVKLLQNVTHDSENMHLLSQIECSFKDTKIPQDHQREFRKCTRDRSVQHYESILEMCYVILNGSYSVYSGEHVSISLMFDMNILYERYVAYWIKRNYPDAKIRTQVTGKKIFGQFNMKMDIVMELKDKTYVLDTKWKRIKNINDVQISDAYQMFAYISRFGSCNEAYLLFPKNSDIHDSKFIDDNGNILHVSFIDIFDVKSICPI